MQYCRNRADEPEVRSGKFWEIFKKIFFIRLTWKTSYFVIGAVEKFKFGNWV